MGIHDFKDKISFLGSGLLNELEEHADIREVPANTVLLRDGQYVKVIPIVLKGLIKVFVSFEEKELLLYYIQPGESCIMSFSASLKNEPSRIVAITEEDSVVLLLPVDKVGQWVKQFPGINQLFYQQYNLRYAELLDTINHLLFGRLDTRLFNYLVEKSRLRGEKVLALKHKQIAAELGTAREVVTRVIKRLEQEGKVKQVEGGIEVLLPENQRISGL
ncbi:MAG: Crp/Fnr family transcriptional regulator [Chitinophagaceae bacterium]|nr:Crp/Fnr family transcriptional regulator [Chitinophagaceae bacterium]